LRVRNFWKTSHPLKEVANKNPRSSPYLRNGVEVRISSIVINCCCGFIRNLRLLITPLLNKKDKQGNHSAFSLIELSIVLIIMGLLVAGVTGGASLVENARLTSLKREVDDHIKDLFTFYARTGRLPGDLDNSGKIGYIYPGDKKYPEGSFSAPYDSINNINAISAPFIELYLYGISSFKPNPIAAAVAATFSQGAVRNIANNGGIPFSKVYKDFMYTHRYEKETYTDTSRFSYGMTDKTAIDMFTTEFINAQNKKIMNIVKKLDIKFDDGAHNGGSIRAYCSNGSSSGVTSYTNAKVCSEIMFYFGVK
jgi:prepilin-type N-terminal cleavage/methylation domain-containing protein